MGPPPLPDPKHSSILAAPGSLSAANSLRGAHTVTGSEVEIPPRRFWNQISSKKLFRLNQTKIQAKDVELKMGWIHLTAVESDAVPQAVPVAASRSAGA